MKAKEVVACATSHPEVDWHSINWNVVNQNVRRLQARIVKATQEGRWGKVKALQRLLTHSFSGKALAVRRVTENHGKNTPGVDGETWSRPPMKAKAIQSLQTRGYKPLPLRRLYIPKKNGKKRPLGIPTMKDRAMQALFLLALDPIAETTGDPNSYGFRTQRSTADASQEVFFALARKDRAKWILEGDIKACFDRISHDWLLTNIPMDKAILKKWLKAGFIENQAFHPTEEGTPQGGIISPVLANMTLDGLERELKTHFRQKWNQASPQINLVRYADDFIITGREKTVLEAEVMPILEAFMQARGLELSKEKTQIVHIDDGFDFLGQNVRKYKGTLLIKPSKKNTKAFLDKVRGVIRANKQASAGNLILQLNPMIQGWVNYHKHIVSKRAFNDADSQIFKALWRWAIRRHPHKRPTWVRKKYFKTVGKRSWVFTGEITERGDQSRNIHLVRASYTPIRRHVKVISASNPYDTKWESYFEQRLGVKMVAELKGKNRLLNLWKSQNGICPVCKQKITKITGWNAHHIVWQSKGGGDQLSNQVLLHPTCHSKVHSQGISVVKPRPAKGVTKA